MKRMKIMVAAIALCGLAACSDNTPKSFTGTITDASMNTVTVENAEGTFTFSTMDADKSEANGLLLGAPVTVNYSGKLEEGAAASKVATDPTYAEALGVNIDSLLVSQPDSGEQALEIAEALVRSGAIDVLVVDSVAALTTKAEIDGEMGDSHVGQLARLMSQAMRKLTAVISKSKCVAIFINQVREKIGVMYGNPETTPGGRALKFYASVRMEVRRGEPIKDGSSQIGNRTKVKINKNKVAPPFREAEFDILYGQGISRTGEVIDVAVELGIVKKGGAWFSYEDQKLGQGRENDNKTLEENPDLMKEIEDKIMEHKDGRMATSKKKKKKSKLEEAAAKAAGGEDAEPGDIVEVEGDGEFNSLEEGESLDISAEDDFEEFDPA